MTATVSFEKHGGVAVVAMNRPEALNGFTTELCNDLLAALEKANDDTDVRAVVLTGTGRCFSAGADLNEGLNSDRSLQYKLQYEYRAPLQAMMEMPKPIIAAVPGFAAGIGLGFVLSCDLVVMAEDAFLLSPFTTISLLPDGGINFLLVRQLGYQRAFQLSIESERISAERCVQLGLANRTAAADVVRDVAITWGQELCKRAPLSVAATKKVMRRAMDSNWSECYNLEAELQNSLGSTEDSAEGIAAFLEKREPVFKGK